MSANAIVALEANFAQWKARRFPSGGGPLDLHEYYCAEQFTRPYALTDGELQSGLTGGSQDGGVDAFYIFANNELVDAEIDIDPKNPPSFRLLVMQIKSDEGFSPAAVDKLNWFLGDLLDLSKGRKDYHTGYREELIRLMRVFKDKYGLVVGDTPKLRIECVYVIKKQVVANDDCERSARDAGATVKQCFAHADIDIVFANAARLWEQVQSRPPITKKLRWAAAPLMTPEGYVGLVKLIDFKEFITDPDGRVAERFFDSNVRGYGHSL